MEALTIDLPYPPSVNRYWRRVGGRTILSRDGRRYRGAVQAVCLERGLGARPLDERLLVRIGVHPPDRRTRDLDNVLKAVLDGLEHAGVYENDGQIDLLVVQRLASARPGRLRVSIEAIAGEPPSIFMDRRDAALLEAAGAYCVAADLFEETTVDPDDRAVGAIYARFAEAERSLRALGRRHGSGHHAHGDEQRHAGPRLPVLRT